MRKAYGGVINILKKSPSYELHHNGTNCLLVDRTVIIPPTTSFYHDEKNARAAYSWKVRGMGRLPEELWIE